MSKEQEIIKRAERVKELLEDKYMKEAFELMEKALFDEFKSAKFKDDDRRTELWQRMQLLALHKSTFEKYLRAGERANQTLLMKLKERVNNG